MATVDQVSGTPPEQGQSVSIKQLKLWAAANGTPLYIYQITNGTVTGSGISADIASTEYIQWFGGGRMINGDGLSDRIQAILNISDEDWATDMDSMLDYPE